MVYTGLADVLYKYSIMSVKVRYTQNHIGRPVGTSAGRYTTQIFYHIGQGPVHPKCILTYRPAGIPHTQLK